MAHVTEQWKIKKVYYRKWVRENDHQSLDYSNIKDKILCAGLMLHFSQFPFVEISSYKVS